MSVREVSLEQFKRLATELRCEPEALMAVSQVEAPRGGFYEDGFPTILFERHKFYKNARRDKRDEWQRLYPAICNHSATPRGGYGSVAGQRVKFSQAFALDPDAAMMACSWGAFQELGENYDDYGFANVGEFVDMMKSGIDGQLDIFVRSIKKRGLVDELQRKNWAGFARNYNGAGYRRFQYDEQMANAYRVFKGKRINWATINTAPQLDEDDILQLTDAIRENEKQIDIGGQTSRPELVESSLTAADLGAGVVEDEPQPETIPADPGNVNLNEPDHDERSALNNVTGQQPQGDPPEAPPSHWFNVEDWKPWAKRWSSRIWGGVTTLSLPTGGGLTFAALNDTPNWHVYAGVAAAVLILIISVGIFATLVVVGIWLWQNRHIPALKAEQLRILADPNMKNVGLMFEKK